MKTGAEPKKVVALVGLMAVAAIVYWTNSSSDAPVSSPAARPAADPAAAVSTVSVPTKIARRDATGHANLGEFSPKLPDKIDPSKIDPTLRLDLLSKVQSIELEGGVRFIFQIGTPPPDPVAVAKDSSIPKTSKVDLSGPQPTAPAPPPTAPPPTVVASTPAINLKYYGYSTKRSDGEKKAFFLDGEDIIVAAEGEIIKKQYKIVRIGVNSVQMEDTAHRSTQTIPLTPEAAPV